MSYQLIDHTADFGIHVFGADLRALFTNAVRAMFENMVDVAGVTPLQKIKVHVTGDDLPDLMVNWLREILFLWAGRELLVTDVDIFFISEHDMDATVHVGAYDPSRHEIKTEIKAVTYHQIQVFKGMCGWEAKIIFDI